MDEGSELPKWIRRRKKRNELEIRHRLDLEEVRWRFDFEQDKTSRSREDLDQTRLDWVKSCTA